MVTRQHDNRHTRENVSESGPTVSEKWVGMILSGQDMDSLKKGKQKGHGKIIQKYQILIIMSSHIFRHNKREENYDQACGKVLRSKGRHLKSNQRYATNYVSRNKVEIREIFLI